MEVKTKEIDFAGRKLSFEVGKLAGQANGSVLARYGETVVLVTAVLDEPAEDLDYFPLSVYYIERLYAGGRIKMSRFVKREGKPTDEATVVARLVDRAIRPLFPSDLTNEVQVIITVLSVDEENDPALLSLIATSLALAISDIPWNGPISGVRVGYKEGSFLLNPTNGDLKFSDLDLIVAGQDDEVVMLEASANQVNDEIFAQAIEFGVNNLKPILRLIEEFREEIGQEKFEYEKKEIDEDLKKEIKDFIREEFRENFSNPVKLLEGDWVEDAKEVLYKKFEGKLTKLIMNSILEKEIKDGVRNSVLEKEVRLDGRKPEEIRSLSCEVGLLPRTHGSAIFNRGDTQALTVVTLGSVSLEQLIVGPAGEETKRYIHHYYFPPFCTGEAGRVGAPSRREVGHGTLAEKALLAVIPSEEDFPYTIRVVTEILSSAGSTSMASVCGSTLALMDAGVPIIEPVAGIAMGLISSEEKSVILSDIAYAEDAGGDMDFKVAGTKNGITAVQMDIKLPGIKLDILKEALVRAREGRLFILDQMCSVIPEARKEISQYAPKVEVVQIDPKKIGSLIGPGGKVINQIIQETGATIDIEEDGTVNIASSDEEGLERAVGLVKSITHEIKAGEIYEGKVARILPFGAIVELLPNKEGMVHISEIAPRRIKSVEDELKVGQKVKVVVTEIDHLGRINLSMKRLKRR